MRTGIDTSIYWLASLSNNTTPTSNTSAPTRTTKFSPKNHWVALAQSEVTILVALSSFFKEGDDGCDTLGLCGWAASFTDGCVAVGGAELVEASSVFAIGKESKSGRGTRRGAETGA